jgi:hypothetical protein
MKNEPLLFLQPMSDQVISIARLILSADPAAKLTAVINQGSRGRATCLKLGYRTVVMRSKPNSCGLNGVLVPAGAESTEQLLRNGPVKIGEVVMEPEVLCVYDKRWFVDHCAKNNLPVPRTFASFSEIEDEYFPIFYKQKYEKGGGVRGLARSRKNVPVDKDDSLIYQEYIDSLGTYGVGFIADKGVIKAHYCHHELSSYPRDGGSAVIVKPCYDRRLIELTKNIALSLTYSGWGLAEYKFCPKRNDYVFMEINAKFWASCELAFRNEPSFMKLFFNIDIPKENIEGIIYINRALQLGVIGFVKSLPYLFKYKTVTYPGICRSVLLGFLPSNLKEMIKRVRGHFSV